MILQGDCLTVLRTLPARSVNCCVTSPPYWGLRNYGVKGQLGLERTPTEYVEKLVEVFREVKRVLGDDGVLWLNLGDAYASSTKGSGGPSKKQTSNAGSRYNSQHFKLADSGLKPKDLVGIPWRVAFALQADGWWLRSDIIWHKPNPMPESVTDRPTKAHEYIFLLAKSERYYYDAEAIKEPFADERRGNPGPSNSSYFNDATTGRGVARARRPITKLQTIGWNADGKMQGRNKRTVWTMASKPFKGAHFATFPPKLIEPCVLAGAPKGGVVLDCFAGAGTTGLVAKQHGRKFIGIELNPAYVEMAEKRIDETASILMAG